MPSGDGAKELKTEKVKSSYWAAVATLLYVAVLLICFVLMSFDIAAIRERNDTILVEFTEPAPPVKPDPPKRVAAAPRHERVATKDNSRQVTGRDEQTRTVNQRALFKTNKGGTDEPVNGGNPYAREAEKESAKGNGGGLNTSGNEFLDEGLQGRGLAGALPLPEYPSGNRGGKVVVRVTVDKSGNVTNAEFDPKGSTTSDAALVQAAIAAAKRAKFTESRAFIQGGSITYVFKMK